MISEMGQFARWSQTTNEFMQDITNDMMVN